MDKSLSQLPHVSCKNSLHVFVVSWLIAGATNDTSNSRRAAFIIMTVIWNYLQQDYTSERSVVCGGQAHETRETVTATTLS